MVQWLFFDLGSTLIDESDCDDYRMQMLVDQPGAPDRGELKRTMEEFAKQNLPFYKETARKYGLTTTKWPAHLEKLYPEVKMTLEQLSLDYHFGIIANQNPGVIQRLKHHGIRQYFQVIASSGELGTAKPNYTIFQWALRQANCVPEEAVMIGDRLDNDIAPAMALGIKTVWVRQGMGKFGNPNMLTQQPNAVIDSIQALPATLKRGF